MVVTEDFCYDALDRLTGYAINPAGGATCATMEFGDGIRRRHT
jgi:hypothetical protein